MTLLTTFESISLATIQDFVDSRREETLHLEFKTVATPDMSRREDRRNLASALSGFSNSAGGIIVWGIDGRRNSDGVDCANELVQIPTLSLFVSRLDQLTGEALIPRLEGIQHRAIPTTNGAGFALTLVPESESGPHMAKLGEDRYYKRSGTSFYRMEHFDVADMFGRRRRPKLSVTARVSGKTTNPQIVLGLRNDGRGSARAPFLAFACPPPFSLNSFGLDGNRNEGMRRLPFVGVELPLRYGEDTAFVIHPGITHEVASLWLGFTPQNLPDKDVTIEFMVCAEDLPLEFGKLTVSIHDLV